MKLYLFTSNAALITATADAIDGFVVDWERGAKRHRQAGYDTQIATDSVSDLRRARSLTGRPIIVRVNNEPDLLERDLECAITHGADEVLIPMVRTAEELEPILSYCRGRVGVGAMVETEEAVSAARELNELPLTRFFVGLNDLAISRGARTIFWPLIDGTIEALRCGLTGPLGFAGLTDPDLGSPIPCRVLLAQMTELGCDYTFLRRSFLRDVRGQDPRSLLLRMRAAIAHAAQTRGDAPAEARRALAAYLGEMDQEGMPA